MFRKLGTTLLMASFVLLAGRSALADSTSYNLTVGNSAITPGAYGTPYGTVSVNRTSTTQATFTFSADAGYLFLANGAAAVNLNSLAFSISGLTGTNSISGFLFTPSDLSNGGSAQEDGFGNFNQTIDEFDGFDHASQTITFTVTSTSGPAWNTVADVLKANNDGNLVAAHIGECNVDPCTFAGGSFSNTGYASETGAINIPTPEPSSLALFGTGILGVAGMVRRRVRVPTA